MKNMLSLAIIFSSFSAVAQNADSAAYYFNKGNEAKTERRYQVALTQYQKAAQFDSSNIELHRNAGIVLTEMRQYEKAKQSFNTVIKKDPNDKVAIENLASLNFYTRKWNEAIAYAKKMQALKIGKGANYIIGKSYYEQEDYASAFTALQAAATEDPMNAEIPYIIARSFVDMSNYKGAAPFFEKAITLDTTKPRWVYEAGLNFSAIPDERTAVKYFVLAAERGYKTDNDYFENLANSYIAIGEAQKGIELMEKILAKKPADMVLLYNLGEIYYKTAKYDKAIEYWDKILGFDKTNARSLYMIGLAYQKKGEKEKGMQLCDRAIQMDPSLANLKEKKSMMGL